MTVLDLIRSGEADRVVPQSGFTALLTIASAAAMAFLAVFVLALALATGRLGERWADELAQTLTVRVSAPAGQVDTQADTVLRVLDQTPGIVSARRLSGDEQQALLAPWFGPDLPLDSLPIPAIVEVVEEGADLDGLRLRLQGEAPGAVLDDHTRWRAPLVDAAGRLRALGWLALGLIGFVTAAMMALAASVSLAANAQVIEVLRLVGARDGYISGAFVRRFGLRALIGASAGTLVAAGTLALLPPAAPSGFLTGLGLVGAEWLWLVLVPPFLTAIAIAATFLSARRHLMRLP